MFFFVRFPLIFFLITPISIFNIGFRKSIYDLYFNIVRMSNCRIIIVIPTPVYLISYSIGRLSSAIVFVNTIKLVVIGWLFINIIYTFVAHNTVSCLCRARTTHVFLGKNSNIYSFCPNKMNIVFNYNDSNN